MDVIQKDKEEKANFYMANEYLDFLEFLEDELGIEYLKELQEKFDKQSEIAADEMIQQLEINHVANENPLD